MKESCQRFQFSAPKSLLLKDIKLLFKEIWFKNPSGKQGLLGSNLIKIKPPYIILFKSTWKIGKWGFQFVVISIECSNQLNGDYEH